EEVIRVCTPEHHNLQGFIGLRLSDKRDQVVDQLRAQQVHRRRVQLREQHRAFHMSRNCREIIAHPAQPHQRIAWEAARGCGSVWLLNEGANCRGPRTRCDGQASDGKSLPAMWTRSAKECACILRMTWPRCAFTVISLMPSWPPTCLLRRPDTTS